MNIPAFAQAPVASFQSSGTLTGPTTRLDIPKDEAQETLDQLKDSFNNWKALDETDQDLLKGVPGEVRLAGRVEGEYTEAAISGTTDRGSLTIFNNEPLMHYGAQWVQVTEFGPQTADWFTIGGNEQWQVGANLTHIDRQLSSDGPISLGGSPVTVTLTDHAAGGYLLYPSER